MGGSSSTQQPNQELLSSNTTAQKTVDASAGQNTTTVGAAAGQNITAQRDLHIYNNAQPTSSQVSTAVKSPSFRCKIPTGTPHYKGRAKIQKEILEYFTEKKSDQPTDRWGQAVAIVGPGGIGKSETACQFAKNYREFFPNAAWINAETEKSTLDSFLRLGKLLEIVLETTKEADVDLVQKVYRHLDTHYEKVLLIFDNAIQLQSNDEDFGIFHYLPTEEANQRFPCVIITSQTPDWQNGPNKIITLDKLSEEASVDFFRCSFRVQSLSDWTLMQRICDEAFKNLHSLLQGYPFAMVLCVSNIDFNYNYDRVSWLLYKIQLYIEKFEREETQILTEKRSGNWPSSYNKTLSSVWQSSFQRLKAAQMGDNSAIILLRASSFFMNPLKTQDLQQVFTECYLCPGTPDWMQSNRLEQSIRLLQKYLAANCVFEDMDSPSSSTLVHHRSFTFELKVPRLLQFVVRLQMNCDELLEDILRYLAFWARHRKSDHLNMSAVEAALGRVSLTTRALTFVGLMACRGNLSARRIVQTRSARVDPAATIWRLYHFEQDIGTLSEDVIGVVRLFVVLSTFGRNLTEKKCFARMALEMLKTRSVTRRVRGWISRS